MENLSEYQALSLISRQIDIICTHEKKLICNERTGDSYCKVTVSLMSNLLLKSTLNLSHGK